MSNSRTVQRKDVFYRSLDLKDFTTFGAVHFDFVAPGVNVFVGENGTGKTHAMKLLFAWMFSQSVPIGRDLGFLKTLLRTMQAESEGSLVRYKAAGRRATIGLSYGERDWSEVLDGRGATNRGIDSDNPMQGIERPVFIPAIEMMGHTKKFLVVSNEFALDFDLTVRDVVSLLCLERSAPAPQYQEIILQLNKDALGGSVEFDSDEERFYLVQDGIRQPAPLVAEGLRKIASLNALLQNGSIKHGRVLFWDEPEVNLNPVLMGEVVRALIAIARSGVQIFLATHSYVLLEELRDQAAKGVVRYFAFDRRGGETGVSATDDLAKLNPNPILRQYESLYNRKMEKAFAESPSE
jgi:hypothetical protein